jgi:hypothetical protein
MALSRSKNSCWRLKAVPERLSRAFFSCFLIFWWLFKIGGVEILVEMCSTEIVTCLDGPWLSGGLFIDIPTTVVPAARRTDRFDEG